MILPTFRRIAAAALLAAISTTAHAQGTARSQDIDTSIRAAGMGGASAGVTWGDPNVWGSPASLGDVEGFRYEHGHTRLVPGLASNVFFDSNRWMFGIGGIGVGFIGHPSGFGTQRLDYGLSEQTDPLGNVIGTFHSFERLEVASAGISVARLADAIGALAGHATRFSDVADVSAGFTSKHVLVVLAPSGLGDASATTRDWGVRGRLSPLRLVAPRGANGAGLAQRVGLDLGYGYSVLNANDARFVFANEDLAAPPTRMKRSGYSVRFTVPMPAVRAAGFEGAILAGMEPLVSLGWAHDHDANDAGGTGQYRYTVDHDGVEVCLANLFTYRRGHWTDRLGDVDGPTTGWGLGLPFGPWGGFRYDHATAPQARDSGLPDVKRDGWTAWLDVVRLLSDMNPAKEGRR